MIIWHLFSPLQLRGQGYVNDYRNVVFCFKKMTKMKEMIGVNGVGLQKCEKSNGALTKCEKLLRFTPPQL